MIKISAMDKWYRIVITKMVKYRCFRSRIFLNEPKIKASIEANGRVTCR